MKAQLNRKLRIKVFQNLAKKRQSLQKQQTGAVKEATCLHYSVIVKSCFL